MLGKTLIWKLERLFLASQILSLGNAESIAKEMMIVAEEDIACL